MCTGFSALRHRPLLVAQHDEAKTAARPGNRHREPVGTLVEFVKDFVSYLAL